MTKTLSSKEHTMKWLRVGDLTVAWPEAQRDLAEYKAKQIAAAFNPDLFGYGHSECVAGWQMPMLTTDGREPARSG